MTDLLLRTHAAGVPWLTVLWALPALLGVMLLRTKDARLAGDVAILGAALTFGLVGALGWSWREAGGHGYAFEQRLSVGPFGYHVALDGLGVVFMLVAALLSTMVALYGRQANKPRHAAWQAYGLFLLACLNGMMTTLDLLLFGLFGLLEILPATALIRGWGTSDAKEDAARLFRRFFAGASALWIAGASLLAWNGGSFDLVDLSSVAVPAPLDGIAFVLLLYALAVRLPLFPFHAWLPPVIEHGPVVGLNVVLLGLKVGVFALVRFVLPLLPEVAAQWSWPVSALGLVGMVYGALVAFAQADLRRMVAFAALSHMGFVVPGIFSLTVHGVEGALLEAVNLGVASAGLYFVVGFLHLRTGTTDLVRLRGLATGVPLLSLTLLVLILTSIGMPGTTGFDGMHLVLEGALDHGDYGIALATGFGTVLAAGVLLVVYQRLVFAAAADPSAPRLPDLQLRELTIAVGLIGAIFGMGVWADPWIDALHDPAAAVAEQGHDDDDDGDDEHDGEHEDEHADEHEAQRDAPKEHLE